MLYGNWIIIKAYKTVGLCIGQSKRAWEGSLTSSQSAPPCHPPGPTCHSGLSFVDERMWTWVLHRYHPRSHLLKMRRKQAAAWPLSTCIIACSTWGVTDRNSALQSSRLFFLRHKRAEKTTWDGYSDFRRIVIFLNQQWCLMFFWDEVEAALDSRDS